MKEYRESISIALPLDDAFELIFNDKDVMGYMAVKNGFAASPWDSNKRVVKFNIPHDNMPKQLVNIVGGGKIGVTTKQAIKQKTDDKIMVDNKVRPHILGAEFVKIRPTFTLTKMNNNKTELDIHCKLFAIFPPPLNHIMEGFMLVATKANYDWFKAALGSKQPSILQ